MYHRNLCINVVYKAVSKMWTVRCTSPRNGILNLDVELNMLLHLIYVTYYLRLCVVDLLPTCIQVYRKGTRVQVTSV
jgi:hypothetical protein